jgi:pimeloyl-ACP methyl ester carboxylesterase
MRRVVAAIAVTGLIAGGAAYASAAQAAPTTTAKAEAAAVVAAPAAVETGATPTFTPKAIKWGKCGIPGFDELGAQCGYLTVPLDYKKPTGTKIKLAVSRIKHTVPAAKYQGVMLTNPGGPGGSGLTLSVLGQYVPGGVGGAYDWIGFDPRGVGSSIPALTCNGNYFKAPRPQYVPTTQKLETTWLNRSKAYAKACDKAGGKLLDHVKTVDTINDMESIRKALGKSKINFYGFSYGSYLGQVYSTLHPTRVRRMVLDGIVDPRGVWYKANLDQDVAFNKSIKVFFAWVAKNDATYKLGTTEAVVEKKYYAALNKLAKKPAGGKLGAAEWNDVFTSAGYYVFGWEDVATEFAAYVNKGDYKPALNDYLASNPTGKGADNGFAMYLATQCTDVKWPTYYKWRADNWQIHANAPFLTWSNVWFNAPCLTWGAKPGTPVTVNGTKAPKMLLINETLDAATPYSGAIEVRKRFPKSVLIEGVGGTTHAGSLNGVSCTDDLIAAYLLDGSLPTRVAGNTSDVQCDPVPAPDPTAAPSSTLKKQAADPFSRVSLQKLIGTK